MPPSSRNAPHASLIPAGSCYYCTIDNGDIQAAIDTLHDTAIGQDTHLGQAYRMHCGKNQILKDKHMTSANANVRFNRPNQYSRRHRQRSRCGRFADST